MNNFLLTLTKLYMAAKHNGSKMAASCRFAHIFPPNFINRLFSPNTHPCLNIALCAMKNIQDGRYLLDYYYELSIIKFIPNIVYSFFLSIFHPSSNMGLLQCMLTMLAMENKPHMTASSFGHSQLFDFT